MDLDDEFIENGPFTLPSLQIVTTRLESPPNKTPTTPFKNLSLCEVPPICDTYEPNTLKNSQEFDSGHSSLESVSSGPSTLENPEGYDSDKNSSNNSEDSDFASLPRGGEDTTDTCISLSDNSLNNITGRPLSEESPFPRDTPQKESPNREQWPLLGSIDSLQNPKQPSILTRRKSSRLHEQIDCYQKRGGCRENQRSKPYTLKRIKSSLEENVTPNVQLTRESQTTEISIKTPTGIKSAGFYIRTDGRSHLIVNVTTLFLPDLGLKDNDEIVAIQNVKVSAWDHSVLTEFLPDVFDPEINTLTLTIKRDNCHEEIFMDFTETDNITGGVKDVLVNIHRYIRHSQEPFVKVQMVEYIGECTCMIRHRIGSDYLYLKAVDKKLTLDHCTGDDNEKLYHFKRHYFSGLQKLSGQFHAVQFCVFSSVVSQKVLSLNGFTKIGLMNQPVDNTIRFVTKPDPRFFRTDRTQRGTTVTIDSLVHPGLFIACNSKRKLTLSSDKSKENVQFEINDISLLPSNE